MADNPDIQQSPTVGTLQDQSSAETKLPPKPRKSKWQTEESDSEDERRRKRRKKEEKKKSKTILPSDSQQPVSQDSAHHDTYSPLPSSQTEQTSSINEPDQPGSSSPEPIAFKIPPINKSFPILSSCRSVDNYEKLNRIEEGAYGVVYRAKDRNTGEIVALKKLKLEKEQNGFPVTSLREIHTLLMAKHPNIVDVREIAVGESLTSIFIVMEFVEHDLKSLMEGMRSPFLQSEVKTLMLQLLSAVALLHDNWIVHRDLKTSNLLMNNQGQIKVADFGLARKFGSPLGTMTQLVVTLWYRAPELLLGAKEYTTAIDMWSVGCIFAELINKEPLLPGRGELDQLSKAYYLTFCLSSPKFLLQIFNLLGMPTHETWPNWMSLPLAKSINFDINTRSSLRSKFSNLTSNGIDLLSKMLAYDPEQRITAEEALKHPYFTESPLPKDPSLFPTFPSKAQGEKRKTYSPSAPHALHAGILLGDMVDYSAQDTGVGFRLRFG
ncbi:kinase-like domain-containing protein [Paraphysoderma sedebokerense]|nr:kinase-like domain-containing protein [Paraphysoderma sedebokerense]